MGIGGQSSVRSRLPGVPTRPSTSSRNGRGGAVKARASIPPRVLGLVAPVCVAGVATVVLACISYGRSAHSSEDVVALAAEHNIHFLPPPPGA